MRNTIKNKIDNLNWSLFIVKILASITLFFFASFSPGLQVLFAALLTTSLAINALQDSWASKPSWLAKAFPRSYALITTLCLQPLSYFFALISFQKNIALLVPYITAWLHIQHIPITPAAVILGSILFIMHKAQTILNNISLISNLSQKLPLLYISKSTIDHIEFTLESTSTFLFFYLTFSPISLPLFVMPLTMIALYALCKSCEPSTPVLSEYPYTSEQSATLKPTDRKVNNSQEKTPLLQPQQDPSLDKRSSRSPSIF